MYTHNIKSNEQKKSKHSDLHFVQYLRGYAVLKKHDSDRHFQLPYQNFTICSKYE